MPVLTVENLDDMRAMMSGIVLQVLLLYVLAGFLGFVWWWFRPKCSLCGRRVTVRKATFRVSSENTKEYLHRSCQTMQDMALPVEEVATETQRDLPVVK